MPTLQTSSLNQESVVNGVVVILLFDFLPQHRSWAWLKLMQGTSGFYKSISGLLFAKVMGSGEGGGFGLRPSATHQGLIFVFDGLTSASDYLKSKEFGAYKEKTREFWQGILSVNSCRGSWNKQSWMSSLSIFRIWKLAITSKKCSPILGLMLAYTLRPTKKALVLL